MYGSGSEMEPCSDPDPGGDIPDPHNWPDHSGKEQQRHWNGIAKACEHSEQLKDSYLA
jgi:hypothetical protein